MTLAPLLTATLAIQLHVIAASAALLCGAAVAILPKGTPTHRSLGRIFAGSILFAAFGSFWIYSGKGYSWIHLLSVITIINISAGIFFRRIGNIRGHASCMVSAFVAHVITGLFTLLPGRLMHQIVIGG